MFIIKHMYMFIIKQYIIYNEVILYIIYIIYI